MTTPLPYICLVCGAPADSLECDRCVVAHDHEMTRREDI